MPICLCPEASPTVCSRHLRSSVGKVAPWTCWTFGRGAMSRLLSLPRCSTSFMRLCPEASLRSEPGPRMSSRFQDSNPSRDGWMRARTCEAVLLRLSVKPQPPAWERASRMSHRPRPMEVGHVDLIQELITANHLVSCPRSLFG